MSGSARARRRLAAATRAAQRMIATTGAAHPPPRDPQADRRDVPLPCLDGTCPGCADPPPRVIVTGIGRVVELPPERSLWRWLTS